MLLSAGLLGTWNFIKGKCKRHVLSVTLHSVFPTTKHLQGKCLWVLLRVILFSSVALSGYFYFRTVVVVDIFCNWTSQKITLPLHWAVVISSRSEKILEELFCLCQGQLEITTVLYAMRRQEQTQTTLIINFKGKKDLVYWQDGWQGRVSELSLLSGLIFLPALCHTSAKLNKSHATVTPFLNVKIWHQIDPV